MTYHLWISEYRTKHGSILKKFGLGIFEKVVITQKSMHFFSMIISLIHHHLRKGDEDMCLISQFGVSQTTRKSKKKFLNYILGVEESRPKLRVRKKFRLKDPRYVNSTPFGAYWLKILYFIKPKKTVFIRWQNERFFYVDYKKKVYIFYMTFIPKIVMRQILPCLLEKKIFDLFGI